MTKKSAKQVKLEEKIAKLRKEHSKLTKSKAALQKVLNREDKTREKQLTKLNRAVDRANAAYDKLYEKDLPSEPASHKLSEKLYKIENQIDAAERTLASQATATTHGEDSEE